MTLGRAGLIRPASRRALRGVIFGVGLALAGWTLAQTVGGSVSDTAAGPASGAKRPAPQATKPAVSKPLWTDLSAAQRSALAPLANDWPTIDPERKAKWLEIAARFPQMPADEQRRVQERMTDWARLTPAERGRARLSFQQAKELTPAERQERWQAYQALPEDQRQALLARSKAPAAAAASSSASAAASGKRNIIGNPTLAAPPAKAVTPTVVQGNPGATTTLVTQVPKPPAHQQTGLPKIAATPSFVDRNTLLPKRGPQGAAAARPPAASEPAASDAAQ